MGRTGGAPGSHRWEEILKLSRSGRICPVWWAVPGGPLRTRVAARLRLGVPSLRAHAHYATAASTRATDLKLPMGYPLAWDLIRWAKEHGAATLRLRGHLVGTAESGDPLGGISDFKRRFTTTS
jgi:hypothetical protein